jgi:hypothetical protein
MVTAAPDQVGLVVAGSAEVEWAGVEWALEPELLSYEKDHQ